MSFIQGQTIRELGGVQHLTVEKILEGKSKFYPNVERGRNGMISQETEISLSG